MSKDTFEWWNKPCSLSAEFITRGKVQENSTAMVQRRREEGKDVSTILGLSKKADAMRVPHGGAYTRAGINGRPREHESKSGKIRQLLKDSGPQTHKEVAEKTGIRYNLISGLMKNDIKKGLVIVIHREGQVRQFATGAA